MARKRFALLALPVVAALAAAGVAIAAASSGAKSASAEFSATTISNKHQATCSANGGDTYTVTVATYKGTTSKSTDDRLDGTIALRVRSVIDTTTGLGRLDGAIRFKGSTGGGKGVIHAAISDGQASGVLQARVKNPIGRLIASFDGSFNPDQGFSSGSIGGSASGAGVVLSGGLCRAAGLHGNAAAHVRAHLKAHGH